MRDTPNGRQSGNSGRPERPLPATGLYDSGQAIEFLRANVPETGEMPLLALDAGIRDTGWAIFHPGRVVHTGIIRVPKSRALDAPGRVGLLLQNLDRLVGRWEPATVAYGQPSGIRWPEPSLELLDRALVDWSAGRRLPFYTYSAQEVRVAIARACHVPQDQLAFAIMRHMGLIGTRKSTLEWEAMAIGYYHLRCLAAGSRGTVWGRPSTDSG